MQVYILETSTTITVVLKNIPSKPNFLTEPRNTPSSCSRKHGLKTVEKIGGKYHGGMHPRLERDAKEEERYTSAQGSCLIPPPRNSGPCSKFRHGGIKLPSLHANPFFFAYPDSDKTCG